MEYRFHRTLTDEHKRKIAESLKGRHHSEETKAKISKRLKEIWSLIPQKDVTQKNNPENKILK